MNLTDRFIHRPVLALVVSLMLFLVGLVCATKLNLRQYPNVSATVISIVTGYPGASAEDIETFITTPLEDQLSGIDHLDTLTSNSQSNQSTLTLTFKLGTDINATLANVYSKVAAARGKLPPDIRDPIIQKVDPNKSPLIYFGLLSKKMSLAATADYFDRAIKPSMQNISGVGLIQMFGDYRYAMNVVFNPMTLAGHGLSAQDFITQLRQNNVYPATGDVQGQTMQYPIQVTHQPQHPNAFKTVPILHGRFGPVRAGDLSKISLGEPPQNTMASVDDQPAVFFGIIPTSEANPVQLSHAIDHMVANLKGKLPADMVMRKFWDAAIFIEDSLHEVGMAIFETAIAVVAIMLLFLGSGRMVWIPAVAIPLSLVGTFSIMLGLGFSINTFTLLAMVLAIGMVVDDAIVVLENIHRHIEAGLSAREAALKGAREIQFPVIAMTLTLAAVYAPIGFLDGVTGILFREFAFTLAGAVILSGIIALTLSPMMCAYILDGIDLQTRLATVVHGLFQRAGQAYTVRLQRVIQWPKSVIATMVILMGGCVAGFVFLPSNLVPMEDSGALMSFIKGPTGANLTYMKPYMQQINQQMKTVPEIQDNALITGMQSENSGMAIALLKPLSQRQANAATLAQQLQKKFATVTGVNAFVVNPFRVPGGNGTMPLGFVVKTLGSLEDLNAGMQRLLNALKDPSSPYYQWKIFFPNTNFKLDRPTLQFRLNRARMADLGVSMQAMGDALGLALSEREQGYFVKQHKRYDVLPLLSQHFKDTPKALKQLHVRTQHGDLIPLTDLITIQHHTSTTGIDHFQKMRAATLAAAALMPGYSMGEALAHIQKTAQSIFPQGTLYDYSGQSRTYMNTRGHTLMLFVYAILFIYLVLAAQYESFRDPFIILTCVPLSTFGALLMLWATGGAINMYTNIGMVTLVGLITKHGILMVDYANHLIAEDNMTRQEAIVRAASIRLRPIVITTVAMLLAALPLAIATGTGHNARNQLGWTIFGGMTLGTILSLFVVPTLYMMLSRRKPLRT